MIIGEDEVKNNQVMVKFMREQKQELASVDKVVDLIDNYCQEVRPYIIDQI